MDLRYFKREGLLRPGCGGTLSWERGGRTTAAIDFRVRSEGLELEYRYRSYGRDWEDVREFARFDFTPCHYGGRRTWLLCPQCERRVVALFSSGSRFLCRHCADLTYASSQEQRHDRLLRKAQTIRERLGGSRALIEFLPEKPKGMHWKTYRRLYAEAERLEQEGWALAAEFFRADTSWFGP